MTHAHAHAHAPCTHLPEDTRARTCAHSLSYMCALTHTRTTTTGVAARGNRGVEQQFAVFKAQHSKFAKPGHEWEEALRDRSPKNIAIKIVMQRIKTNLGLKRTTKDACSLRFSIAMIGDPCTKHRVQKLPFEMEPRDEIKALRPVREGQRDLREPTRICN